VLFRSNALCDMERGFITFEQSETTVMREFGIETRAQCQAVLDRLSASFEKRVATF
jgi:hypothetical protein